MPSPTIFFFAQHRGIHVHCCWHYQQTGPARVIAACRKLKPPSPNLPLVPRWNSVYKKSGQALGPKPSHDGQWLNWDSYNPEWEVSMHKTLSSIPQLYLEITGVGSEQWPMSKERNWKIRGWCMATIISIGTFAILVFTLLVANWFCCLVQPFATSVTPH